MSNANTVMCICGHPESDHGYEINGSYVPFCSLGHCDCMEFEKVDEEEDEE